MYVDVADSPAGPRLGWFLLRVAGMGRGRLIGLFVVLLAGWVGTSGALAAPPDADEAGEAARTLPGLEMLAVTAISATSEPGVFSVDLPGDKIKIEIFQPKPAVGKPWHAQVVLDDPGRFSFRPVRAALADRIFGDVAPQRVVLIASSKSEKIDASRAPKSTRGMLAKFSDDAGKLDLKEGVNFFALMRVGRTGVIGLVNRALDIGKAPIRVSGLVDRATIELALSGAGLKKQDGEARKKALSSSTIALKVVYPSITPPPFRRVGNKKVIHMVYPSTRLSITATGTDSYKISGGQQVRLWILGNQIDIDNKMSFKQKGDKYEVAVRGTRSTDWKDLFGIEGFAIKEITLSGDLKGSGKSSTKSKKSGSKSKDKGQSADGALAIGAVVALPQHGPLAGSFSLDFTKNKITELRLQLGSAEGGEGVNLGALPGLKLIPASDNLRMDALSVGLNPTNKDVNLQGRLTWPDKGITGQATILRKTISGGKKTFIVFLQVEGLNLRTLAPALPEKAEMLSLDRGLLIISSAGVKQMKIDELPKSAREMVQKVTSNPDFKMPIYQGVTILARFDPAAVAPELKSALSELGVTEPMVLAGSIGGVIGGDPSLALYADLPTLPIPRVGKNPLPIKARTAGVKFFLEAQTSSAGVKLDLGIEGNVGLLVGDDELEFGGRMFVTLSAVSQGVRIAGRMTGKWNEPFELQGISLSNLEIEGGYDPPTSISFRVLGDANFGRLKYSVGGDIKLVIMPNPPWCVPKVIGLRFEGSEISALTMMQIQGAMIRGAIGGPLANTIPDGEMKSLLRRVASRDIVSSIEEVVPLPYLKFEDVAIYLMTPGAEIGDLDGVSGLGMAVRGRAVFMDRMLGETECFLTLRSGFRMYAHPGDLNLGPLLTLQNAAFDIRVPLPGLQRTEKAYAMLTGNMGAGCSVLSGAIDMRFSRDLARFATEVELAGYSADFKAEADLSQWPEFGTRVKFGKDLVRDTLESITSRLSERVEGAKAEAQRRIEQKKAEIATRQAKVKEVVSAGRDAARVEVDKKIASIQRYAMTQRDRADRVVIRRAWGAVLEAARRLKLRDDNTVTGIDQLKQKLNAINAAAGKLRARLRNKIQGAVAEARKRVDDIRNAAAALKKKVEELPAVKTARQAVEDAQAAFETARKEIAARTIDPVAAWVEDARDTLVIEEIGFNSGLEALCDRRLPKLNLRGSFAGKPFDLQKCLDLASKEELASRNAKNIDAMMQQLFDRQ